MANTVLACDPLQCGAVERRDVPKPGEKRSGKDFLLLKDGRLAEGTVRCAVWTGMPTLIRDRGVFEGRGAGEYIMSIDSSKETFIILDLHRKQNGQSNS